jgi:hypothetical protein
MTGDLVVGIYIQGMRKIKKKYCEDSRFGLRFAPGTSRIRNTTQPTFYRGLWIVFGCLNNMPCKKVMDGYHLRHFREFFPTR